MFIKISRKSLNTPDNEHVQQIKNTFNIFKHVVVIYYNSFTCYPLTKSKLIISCIPEGCVGVFVFSNEYTR